MQPSFGDQRAAAMYAISPSTIAASRIPAYGSSAATPFSAIT
jgi:hypothetical protein